jgi:hypothetical protein
MGHEGISSNNNIIVERFEVFTAVSMIMMFFWVLAPC